MNYFILHALYSPIVMEDSKLGASDGQCAERAESTVAQSFDGALVNGAQHAWAGHLVQASAHCGSPEIHCIQHDQGV